METKSLHEHKLASAVLGLDQAPDGSALYAACLDGGVYVVNPESGQAESVGAHENYATSVHRLPEQPVLVSGGYDGSLLWHDLDSRKTIRRVKAHQFWSWQTAVSPNGQWVASVTGQYLAGGYKYEPAEEQEPSLRIYHAATGELAAEFSHEPPVQSVAFSPDNRHVAAGNLMGRLRIWDLETGKMAWQHHTESFTGWGIIKGHYYTGGIFSMMFTADGKELLVCGMGATRDPAAGNGKQLWEKFDWNENRKTSQAQDDEIGKGLMETLAWHPSHEKFVMAGRLFNGKWNTAIFESKTGSLLHSMDTKMRTTQARFSTDGTRLILAGTTDQGKKKDGEFRQPGRIKTYSIA